LRLSNKKLSANAERISDFSWKNCFRQGREAGDETGVYPSDLKTEQEKTPHVGEEPIPIFQIKSL
jgi:hypothetical protein